MFHKTKYSKTINSVHLTEMGSYYIDSCILLLLLSLCCVGIILLKRGRYQLVLLSIIAIGLILRIISSSDPFLHAWDERYHALVAKNLIEHPLTPTLHNHPILSFDNNNWVGSHLWFGKPLFPLWLLSCSISIFGNTLFAVRLPSILLGLLAIWLTYKIGKYLFHEKIGLLAAFFHAINGLVIELIGGRVSSDHVEACFITMVELGIFIILLNLKDKKSLKLSLLIGIVTGIAFMSKWYPGLIILPIWFVSQLLYYKNTGWQFIRSGLLIIIGMACILVPWLSFMYYHYPTEINAILWNSLVAYSDTVENHSAPFYYYWHKIMVIYGELIYIPIGYSIYCFFKTKEKYKQALLLTWIFIPLILFSFADTKRFTYLLIAAPAFFIVTSVFWFHLADQISKYKQKWIVYSMLVILIALPLRYTIERSKIFTSTSQNSPAVYAIMDSIKMKVGKKTILFGAEDYIEIMFHTDVYAAYKRIPSLAKIEALREEGFEVILYSDLID